MKYCSYCGVQLADNDIYCSRCGKPVYTPAAEQQAPPTEEGSNPNYYYSQPNPNNPTYNPKVKRPLNTLNLVWGIVNAALGTISFFPLILGIAAIVFTVIAQDAVTDYDYQYKLKIAKILNIVGSGLCVLGFFFGIFLSYLIFGTLASIF